MCGRTADEVIFAIAAMFELLAVRDTVKVVASALHADVYNNATPELLLKILRREIRLNYVGRVLPNRGVILGCHAIRSVGEAQVFPGDAAWYFTCEFTLMMLNPKKHDTVSAVLLSSFRTELQLTMGFFQELYMLPDRLPVPREFHNGLWHWLVHPGDDLPPNRMTFDFSDSGRYRVVEVLYNVKTPARPVVYKHRRHVKGVAGLPDKETEELKAIRDVIQKRDAADIALASQFNLLGLDDDDEDENGAKAEQARRAAASSHSNAAQNRSPEETARYEDLKNGRAMTILKDEGKQLQCEMHTAPMVIMLQAADSGLGSLGWW